MQEGVVKWFDERKGYGFIESEGKDYFCHISAIHGNPEPLKEGDRVTFEPLETPKGLSATDVTRE